MVSVYGRRQPVRLVVLGCNFPLITGLQHLPGFLPVDASALSGPVRGDALMLAVPGGALPAEQVRMLDALRCPGWRKVVLADRYETGQKQFAELAGVTTLSPDMPLKEMRQRLMVCMTAGPHLKYDSGINRLNNGQWETLQATLSGKSMTQLAAERGYALHTLYYRRAVALKRLNIPNTDALRRMMVGVLTAPRGGQ